MTQADTGTGKKNHNSATRQPFALKSMSRETVNNIGLSPKHGQRGKWSTSVMMAAVMDLREAAPKLPCSSEILIIDNCSCFKDS